MKFKDTAAFILLGLIWGQTFLWIKIGVEGMPTTVFVALRIAFAVFFLGLIVLLTRPKRPLGWQDWSTLVVMGLINNAIPFMLVAWGEERIDSAIAAILHSMVPLFTMLIAHFTLADDRIDTMKVSGLTLGFFGVVVILMQDLGDANFLTNIIRQGAVLLASLFYAIGSVFARHNARNIKPIYQAFFPLIIADVFSWSLALSIETPLYFPQDGLTWISVLYLGFIASGVGYLLFYYLIQSIGPTKTTLVTYIFPVIGVVLGVIFLDERLVWNTIVGGLMVILGIVVVNWRSAPVVESGEI